MLDIKQSRLRFEVRAHLGNAVHSCGSKGINSLEIPKYDMKSTRADETAVEAVEIEAVRKKKTVYNSNLLVYLAV